ncbi:SUPPRESSOR OF SILENCING 3 [Artemisia annua]|uniref:SUPPRESSOR OF SILENCING 3 n=1 Tax=Artemisia annua TaxID=35608 RepID=A0A2U1N9C1_ARTAN|nr:SUPPRESSOR OF SILENCING 3 [Artemisia annua]
MMETLAKSKSNKFDGDKEDMSDLENKFSKLNPMAQEFVPRVFDFDVDQLNQVVQVVLNWSKNKVFKEKKYSRAMEEALDFVCQKMRKTVEGFQLVRERTMLLHDQTKEELNSQEPLFKVLLKVFHNSRFNKLLLEEGRTHVHQDYSTMDLR